MNIEYFKRALALAQKKVGLTSPNPTVGAVIVKGDEVVAEGVHAGVSSDHAEVCAINDLMKKSGVLYTDLEPALFKNADLYVTLEPCCHFGKTPPCVDAIVRAGFRNVYIGMIDPSKKINGKSLKILKNAGISTKILKSSTPLSREIRDLNQPFIKFETFGLPYVVVKAGMSIDGKIATSGGFSKWITSNVARDDARFERSCCDAVLVGAGTVLADDPELSLDSKFKNKNFTRCVFGRKLNLPLDKKIFNSQSVVYFVSDLGSKKNQEKYKKANVKVKKISDGKAGIRQLLSYLAKLNIQSLMVEGGSSVNGRFFDAFLKDQSLIDRFLFYVSPRLIGGEKSLPVVGGEGAYNIDKSFVFEDFSMSNIGKDIKVSSFVNRY